MFEEIVAPSMKELFIQSIESLILSGELPVGEKLPTERDLAAKMKVSRSIVNLGLNELERKGFVEIIPRQGTYVADYIQKGSIDTLISIVNYNGGRISRHLFHSIMEFRMINECEAVSLAAENRTDADLEHLENHCQELLHATEPEAIIAAISKFHHAIFCATGNTIFPLVYNAFEKIYLLMIRTISRYFKTEESVDRLQLILKAIRSQNAENAKKAMLDLIEEGRNRLEDNYFDD